MASTRLYVIFVFALALASEGFYAVMSYTGDLSGSAEIVPSRILVSRGDNGSS